MNYSCCQHCDDSDYHRDFPNTHDDPCPDGCNDKTYLTVNGQPLGFLSPRDEEVFLAGKIAALADLYAKVEVLGPPQSLWNSPNAGEGWLNAIQAVLELIDGSSDD